jgi:hypothetical protein
MNFILNPVTSIQFSVVQLRAHPFFGWGKVWNSVTFVNTLYQIIVFMRANVYAWLDIYGQGKLANHAVKLNSAIQIGHFQVKQLFYECGTAAFRSSKQ